MRRRRLLVQFYESISFLLSMKAYLISVELSTVGAFVSEQKCIYLLLF